MFFVYIITYTNKNAIILFKKAHDIPASNNHWRSDNNNHNNQCLNQQGLHQMFLQSSGSPDSALPSQHVISLNNVLSPAAGLQDSGILPGPSQFLSQFSHQSSDIPSHVGTVSYNSGYVCQQPRFIQRNFISPVSKYSIYLKSRRFLWAKPNFWLVHKKRPKFGSETKDK